LGVSVALSEHEVHWRSFLQSLVSRGLCGVRLIVSDAHEGLKAARLAVFGEVPWQRCQFHWVWTTKSFIPEFHRSPPDRAAAPSLRNQRMAGAQGRHVGPLRTEFPPLEAFLWGGHFWGEGYFAETRTTKARATKARAAWSPASAKPKKIRS